MNKKRWWESQWLLVAFSALAGAVAVKLLEEWTAVKETFGVLLVVLVLAAAGRLLVVSHRDEQRKQAAHEDNLVRIREETAKTKEERATAREAKAEEQRVEEQWENAAEQLWSDESRELIVASARSSIEDSAFSEAAVKLHRHLGGIFSDYFFPLRWTDSDHYLWRGFVVQLERIAAQLPPSAENARLVWDTAVRWGDYRHILDDTEFFARSRDMCRRCAFFTLTLPEQVQNLADEPH